MFIQELDDSKDYLTLHQLEDEMKQLNFTGTRFLFGDTMKYQLDEYRTLLVTYYNNYTLHETKWFLSRKLVPRRKYIHVEYVLGYSGGASAICDTPYEARQAIGMFIKRMNNPSSRDAILIHQGKQRLEKLLAEL